MRMQAHHEQSEEHAHNLSDNEMWIVPPDLSGWEVGERHRSFEEIKKMESRIHVDHVRDIIPFWIRGVEAAKKGEVLRMEEFLNSIKEDPDPWGDTAAWATSGGWGAENPWNGRDEEWAQVPDWVISVSTSSVDGKRTQTSVEQKNKVLGQGREELSAEGIHDSTNMRKRRISADADSYTFVEDIARREAASADRKRRMHLFFEMSTQDKVKTIEEVIRHLRSCTN